MHDKEADDKTEYPKVFGARNAFCRQAPVDKAGKDILAIRRQAEIGKEQQIIHPLILPHFWPFSKGGTALRPPFLVISKFEERNYEREDEG